jgi:ankyrin repeat protein
MGEGADERLAPDIDALARERLRVLRSADPTARLSAAQADVALQLGFDNWRSLQREMHDRRAPRLATFFTACTRGDVASLGDLLSRDPSLARARDASGTTGLHLAIVHPQAVRLLLTRGADPNARDSGDNASALHFAAAHGYLDTVRALIDAGGDVHGIGDVHLGGVIGWAAGDGTSPHRDIVDLLIAHGARHHIFSAIALDDGALVERVVEDNPAALTRRRSIFEKGQTSLHFALASPAGHAPKRPQYEIADLLIALGADVDAEDHLGRTPLAVALLSGDAEAVRRLRAAGAAEPAERPPGAADEPDEALRYAIGRPITPTLCVTDVGATVAWYRALGFTLDSRHPDNGPITWAALSWGKASLTIQPRVRRPHDQVALWLHIEAIDTLYQALRARQLTAAGASAAPAGADAVHFLQDLYEPFYGGRQFSIRDLNGCELVFTTL